MWPLHCTVAAKANWWLGNGSLKTYILSMEDKVADGVFGHTRNYGWDGPFKELLMNVNCPSSFSWRILFVCCHTTPIVIICCRRQNIRRQCSGCWRWRASGWNFDWKRWVELEFTQFIVKLTHVYHCHHTGIEDFQSALEHWYEALENLMISRRASVLSDADAFVKHKQEAQLHALIGSSRKLRKIIDGPRVVASPPRPQTPTHVLTWLDEECVESEQLLPLEGLADDGSSDSDSFVSANETSQLEVRNLTSDSSQ